MNHTSRGHKSLLLLSYCRILFDNYRLARRRVALTALRRQLELVLAGRADSRVLAVSRKRCARTDVRQACRAHLVHQIFGWRNTSYGSRTRASSVLDENLGLQGRQDILSYYKLITRNIRVELAWRNLR